MKSSATTSVLPSLFVPHGAPTFALEPGAAGAALASLARSLPMPKAILVVSAHWDTQVPTLSIAPRLETMHDFYGFPPPLYDLRYPASGAVPLAMEARALLEEAGFEVVLDTVRGLDHGAWVPLRLMYPQADVPVLAMSVQGNQGPAHHYRLGQVLAPLVHAGVLVVGSGNLTHNLWHFGVLRGAGKAPDYVTAFQDWVWKKLLQQDIEALLEYRSQAPGAVDAHPTDEHLLPLHVALGAAGADFSAQRIYSGVEHNMLAMDCYAFWPAISSKEAT